MAKGKAPTDIRSLARTHTVRAIQVLAGIMDNPHSLESARVAAANSLLDRGWGKAPQEMTVTRKNANEMTDTEIVELIRELSGPAENVAEPKIDPSQLN